MAFLCRSFQIPKQLFAGSVIRGIHIQQFRLINMKTCTAGSAALESKETHDERNARLKRPQSPHLTIYKPQLTSMMSITHRGTGMLLGYFTAVFGIGTMLSSSTFPEIIQSIDEQQINQYLLSLGKILLVFPFAYHYCNGVRHLFWDMGKALTIKQVYLTGYISLGASVLLTLYLMSL